MRIVTWNLNKATKKNIMLWDYLRKINPDIALLQEVVSMPDVIKKEYNELTKVAIYKTGKPQIFNTVVLTKGIIEEITLKTDLEWINRELEFFKGNFISCTVKLKNQKSLNVVSVHSPAWPVNEARIAGIDVSDIKLEQNSKVWPTEIIWYALKYAVTKNDKWIVGGDYNISETFDKEWQDKNRVKFGIRSSGNKEILNRMDELGFTECLRKHKGKITPTYKNLTGGKIFHQLDHLFVTNNLASGLTDCQTGEASLIFENNISNHLPIIADFKI